MVSGHLRFTRGVLLGLAMLLLTSVAHSAGHGQLPDATAYLLLAPISIGLGLITMDRARGWLWFISYAVGTQVLMHVLLTTAVHTSHASLVPSQSMAIMHLLAAVVVGILLAHGDGAVLRWVSYMHAALFLATSHLPTVSSLWTPLDYQAPPTLLSHILQHEIARRGPPVRCL